jgi:hypothetical protein
MILINSSYNINLLYEVYKKSVLATYEKLKLSNDKSINKIIELFGNDKIIKAINNMRINYLSQIVIDEHTEDSLIARYLEFGGQDIKAIHLFSRSRKGY